MYGQNGMCRANENQENSRNVSWLSKCTCLTLVPVMIWKLFKHQPGLKLNHNIELDNQDLVTVF